LSFGGFGPYRAFLVGHVADRIAGHNRVQEAGALKIFAQRLTVAVRIAVSAHSMVPAVTIDR
jgi:hypothetical protein